VGPNDVAVGWGRVFANSGDTGIVALESSSGRERWRFEPTLVASEGIDIQPTVRRQGIREHRASELAWWIPRRLSRHRSRTRRDHGREPVELDTVDSADIWGDSPKSGTSTPAAASTRRSQLQAICCSSRSA
jgi:hypothetical protein